MATIAMTAEGFSNAEMYDAAKSLRRIVYARVPGVRKVEFFGRVEPRVFIEFDNVRLSRMGLSARFDSVGDFATECHTSQAEGSRPTVRLLQSSLRGDLSDLDEIKNITIAIPDTENSVYLSDIADIRFGYEDPPSQPAFWNGQEAIIVSVSMVDQFNAFEFGKSLKRCC